MTRFREQLSRQSIVLTTRPRHHGLITLPLEPYYLLNVMQYTRVLARTLSPLLAHSFHCPHVQRECSVMQVLILSLNAIHTHTLSS
jgi:hypothetical protein